jgi:hypothetical protein
MRNDIYQKIILFVGVACFLISCGDRRTEYINHRKWFTENGYNPAPLKGHPKEVKENFYTLIDDTSFDATGKRNFYDQCKFDSSGNLTFMRYFIDSNMVADADYNFTDEGLSRSLTIYQDTNASRIAKVSNSVSSRIGGNKFKAAYYDNNDYQYHLITTFLSGGKAVKIEKWRSADLLSTQTLYYNNGRLIKTENQAESERLEETYHYSKEGYLENIIETNSKGESKSKVFINNEYGDPISFTAIENNVVQEKHHMKYLYDEKGNWIKEIIVSEIYNYGNSVRFPKSSMVIREIKY